MKQKIIRKQKPIPLELHKGCRGCTNQCVYNKLVTTKLKNSQVSDIKYGCNTSKGKLTKIIINYGDK